MSDNKKKTGKDYADEIREIDVKSQNPILKKDDEKGKDKNSKGNS